MPASGEDETMEGRSQTAALVLDAAALLDSIVDLTDDAIMMLDPQGGIMTWSGPAERLFGTRAEEVVGSSVESLFAGHLRPAIRSVVARVGAGETITHLESEIVRSDGMPIAVWLSICPVPADPPCTVVIARDVTEQHVAQATLAEVESRLREGESLSHVGSWLWDLRTGVAQWSTEFHRIHGVDPFEFDGTFESHMSRIHPDDRSGVESAMKSAVSTGRPFEGEYRIVRPDGQIRVLRVRAQPSLGSAGTTVGLRGIGQDVTGSAPPSVSSDPPGS